MEICISITSATHPVPPMAPLEIAVSEKLASGVSTSLIEANVWRTQDFMPESWWGNDYMHARYYSPTLARFVSVDPVSGDIGSSQSWNRYAYALNNPLKYTDPDGRNPAIALPIVAGLIGESAIGAGLVGGAIGIESVMPVQSRTSTFLVTGLALQKQMVKTLWSNVLNENTSESGEDEVIIDDATKSEDWWDQAVDDHDGTEESADEIDKRQRNHETMREAQRKRHQRQRRFENGEIEGDPDDVLRPGQTPPQPESD